MKRLLEFLLTVAFCVALAYGTLYFLVYLFFELLAL